MGVLAYGISILFMFIALNVGWFYGQRDRVTPFLVSIGIFGGYYLTWLFFLR